MAIVNTSTAKVFLNITGTSEDALLDLLCSHADAAIKSYCNRDIELDSSTSATEYYKGNGGKSLVLRRTPVTAISNLYVDSAGYYGDNPDGAFASTTEKTEGTDFVVNWDSFLPGTTTACSKSGIITRIGSIWPQINIRNRGMISTDLMPGIGNIKVVYTAGYITVPADLEYAGCLLVAHMRRINEAGANLQSESLGGYSYSLAQNDAAEIGNIKQILNKYRRLAI